MKILLYAWLLFVAVKGDEPGEEVYNKNNPYELKNDKVFYSSFGQVFELYNSEGEIRNILVPPTYSLYNFDFFNPDPNKHPPIYFNLYKNGQNEGIYVLKNKVAKRIKDGTDSTSGYYKEDFNNTGVIYISANDGIYTYNPENEEIKKFGKLTEEFKAIDKTTSNTDEIYVLGADNKIYKITSQGTVKTKVDGIDYAKDFVLDFTGNIFFLGEDNKPRILYKDNTTSVEVTGLNFDVKNAFLCKEPSLYEISKTTSTLPFVVDGVCFTIMNNRAHAVPADAVVKKLTALSVEWSFLHFYGEKGRIYMHDILASDPPSTQKKRGSSKNYRKVVFDRDAQADYNTVKSYIFHQ